MGTLDVDGMLVGTPFSSLKGTDTDKMGTSDIFGSSLGRNQFQSVTKGGMGDQTTHWSTSCWASSAFTRSTTLEILSLSSEVASDFHWLRSAEETTTFASTIDSAETEVGLGGNGKRSAVPVLGGVNAERGNAGGALSLRIPALEGVGGGADILEEGDGRLSSTISTDRNFNHPAKPILAFNSQF